MQSVGGRNSLMLNTVVHNATTTLGVDVWRVLRLHGVPESAHHVASD
jgi:hypothetical protein